MSEEKIVETLKKVSGATFASLDTTTPVTLKGGKRNPHQGRVLKVTSNLNVMVFSNTNCSGYVNMVRRNLEKEGKDPNSFIPQPSQWGKHIANTPLFEHNDKMYVQAIIRKPGKVEYLLDGNPIDPEYIEGFPEDRKTNQGLSEENDVQVRRYNIENIDRIRILGEVIE